MLPARRKFKLLVPEGPQTFIAPFILGVNHQIQTEDENAFKINPHWKLGGWGGGAMNMGGHFEHDCCMSLIQTHKEIGQLGYSPSYYD